MTKLTKLPNGTWIDLKRVTAILALPTSTDFFGGGHRARVRIDHGAQNIEIIIANDDEDAQRIADEYAEQINTL